jgi:hypothetical protein
MGVAALLQMLWLDVRFSGKKAVFPKMVQMVNQRIFTLGYLSLISNVDLGLWFVRQF